MVKKEETTKPAKKTAVKAPAARKPRAPKKAAEETKAVKAETAVVKAEAPKKHKTTTSGKYVFATGRRKTAIANVRLFEGKGDSTVNKKPFETYFFTSIAQTSALKPLNIVGMASDFYFYATINGGGINAQAQALQHGIAQALSKVNAELRPQLKKNGLLTRDDRKKERKKPGLKRARRSPQWAKR